MLRFTFLDVPLCRKRAAKHGKFFYVLGFPGLVVFILSTNDDLMKIGLFLLSEMTRRGKKMKEENKM